MLSPLIEPSIRIGVNLLILLVNLIFVVTALSDMLNICLINRLEEVQMKQYIRDAQKIIRSQK